MHAQAAAMDVTDVMDVMHVMYVCCVMWWFHVRTVRYWGTGCVRTHGARKKALAKREGHGARHRRASLLCACLRCAWWLYAHLGRNAPMRAQSRARTYTCRAWMAPKAQRTPAVRPRCDQSGNKVRPIWEQGATNVKQGPTPPIMQPSASGTHHRIASHRIAAHRLYRSHCLHRRYRIVRFASIVACASHARDAWW